LKLVPLSALLEILPVFRRDLAMTGVVQWDFSDWYLR
jgi:hypothetical protein